MDQQRHLGGARARGQIRAQMLHLEWAGSEQAPLVELVSRIATRDRAVDLSKRDTVPPLSADQHKLYTASTDLMPTDGIVKTTADSIVGWAFSDQEKARRIYEWIGRTCARWRWKSRRGNSPWTIQRWPPHARRCSAPGR